jgi:hypothetical protein
MATPPATHQESDHREGRRGGRRVPGRERGRGEPGELREVRPGAVDDHLDEIDDGELAEHGEGHDGGNGAVRQTPELDDPDDHRQADDTQGAAEIAEPAKHGGRTRGGMHRAPPGKGEVVVGHPRLRPDHEEQDAGRGGEGHHGRDTEGQCDAGGELRVDASAPPAPEEMGCDRVVVRPAGHDGRGEEPEDGGDSDEGEDH